MLEFATPLWLLVVPLALIVPWLRRGTRIQFSSLSAVKHRRSMKVWFALCSPVLASLALTALTVALARPQMVERERVIEREGIDIQIVLDTSGSMEAEDFVIGGRAASRCSA